MTNIEELALLLYGQLEAGDWKHSNLELIEDALRAAKASGLTWTTEKPTQPGWYWWRKSRRHEIEIAKLWDVDNIYGQFHQDPHVFRVDEVGGEWAGPLAPPEETRK